MPRAFALRSASVPATQGPARPRRSRHAASAVVAPTTLSPSNPPPAARPPHGRRRARHPRPRQYQAVPATTASPYPHSPPSYPALAAALTLQPTPLVAAGTTARGGRGLVALRPIPAGTVLLSVDVACALIIADATPVPPGCLAAAALGDWAAVHGAPLPPLLASFVLTAPDNWFARAVAWLLWATRHGPPAWRQYGAVLPALDDLASLMAFTPGEAAALLAPAPGLVAAAAAERAAIAGLHDRLFSSVTGSLAPLDLAPTLDHTLRAAALVNSRSFAEVAPGTGGTTGGGGDGGLPISLVVPCVDLANHDPDAPNAAFGFIGGDAFGLTALRALEGGEEVTISYTGGGGGGGGGGPGSRSVGGAPGGSKDSTRMLRDYGFVPAGNAADRLAPLAATPAEAGGLGEGSGAWEAACAREAAAAVGGGAAGASPAATAAGRRAVAALASIGAAAAAPVGGGGAAGSALVGAGGRGPLALPPLLVQARALAVEADGRAAACEAASAGAACEAASTGAMAPSRAAAAAGWWAERAALARAVVALLED